MRRLRWFLASLSSGFGLFKALQPLQGLLRTGWNAGVLRGLGRFFLFAVAHFWAAIRWCSVLEWRLFLQGAPALILGAVVATFSIMALFTRAQELETRYLEQAKAAVRAKDYKEALACYERLSQLQQDRPDIVYELALAAEANGQLDRCVLLMQQVAPPDKPGYPQAHLWNGAYLIARSLEFREARQLAKAHLRWALEGGVQDKDAAHGLLGELYLAERQFDEAERHLLSAVKTKPHARLRLAFLYALRGDLDSAKREGQTAAKWYGDAAAADWSAHLRLKWAEATVFLEDFPRAVQILEEGLIVTKEDRYRTSLAGVYASWFDFLTRKGNPNPALRIATLERGLRHDPKNLGLLNRVLFVTGIKGQPLRSPVQIVSGFGLAANRNGLALASGILLQQQAEIHEARTTLRELLAKGEVTAPIHFALGIDAWENGLPQEAQRHWERAFELAPDTPVLANNLAWLLYQTDPKQLQKALDLVNIAVAKAPGETNFRDTRGHILAKLGKHEEALRDLETALPRSPNKEALHRALAEVYQRLNSPSMAAEHTRQALELARQKEKRQ